MVWPSSSSPRQCCSPAGFRSRASAAASLARARARSSVSKCCAALWATGRGRLGHRPGSRPWSPWRDSRKVNLVDVARNRARAAAPRRASPAPALQRVPAQPAARAPSAALLPRAALSVRALWQQPRFDDLHRSPRERARARAGVRARAATAAMTAMALFTSKISAPSCEQKPDAAHIRTRCIARHRQGTSATLRWSGGAAVAAAQRTSSLVRMLLSMSVHAARPGAAASIFPSCAAMLAGPNPPV